MYQKSKTKQKFVDEEKKNRSTHDQYSSAAAPAEATGKNHKINERKH